MPLRPLRGPDVSLSLETARDIAIEAFARDLIRTLKDFSLTPSHMGHWEPLDQIFDEARFAEMLCATVTENESYRKGYADLGAKKPAFEVSVDWVKGPQPYPNSLLLVLPESYFKESDNVERFVQLAARLFGVSGAFYGNALHSVEQPKFTGPSGSLGRFADKGLVDVFWLNLFGPEYVRFFGAEKFQSMPHGEVRRLERGGLMFVSRASPLQYGTEETKLAEECIKRHLDRGAFLDRDHPDKALNHPVIDLSELRVALAESVTRTSAAVLEAQEKWIRERGRLAQRFVDRMTRGGVSLDYGEASLAALDRHLAGKGGNEELVREAAAYLSEVILRSLPLDSPGLLTIDRTYGEVALMIPSLHDGIFPLDRVRKLCAQGKEYSLSFLWRTIKARLGEAENKEGNVRSQRI